MSGFTVLGALRVSDRPKLKAPSLRVRAPGLALGLRVRPTGLGAGCHQVAFRDLPVRVSGGFGFRVRGFMVLRSRFLVGLRVFNRVSSRPPSLGRYELKGGFWV